MKFSDNTMGFEERILPMLRQAVVERSFERQSASRPARRRWIAVLAAVLTVGVLLGGVALGRGQTVLVSGDEALSNPRAVEQELRSQGIDASIIDVPVASPERNGTWWWVYADRPMDVLGTDLVSRDISAPDMTKVVYVRILELPKGLEGHVTLMVGKTAGPGEPTVDAYDSINELAPTGAFYCLHLDPLDPAAVGEALTRLGYQVEWNFEDGNQGSQVEAPPPGTVITWAWIPEPGLVDVRISPDGPEATSYRLAEGTFLPGDQPAWAPPCG